MKFVIPILLAATVLTFAGCGSNATATPVEAPVIEDQASLIAGLQAAGAAVEVGDSVIQDFFTPEGTIVRVNGQDLQVFEYDTAEDMESEASLVAPDGGSIGTSMVMWVDAPHFYKIGRMIVLYVGSDQGTLDLLQQVVDPQFAGQ